MFLLTYTVKNKLYSKTCKYRFRRIMIRNSSNKYTNIYNNKDIYVLEKATFYHSNLFVDVKTYL